MTRRRERTNDEHDATMPQLRGQPDALPGLCEVLLLRLDSGAEPIPGEDGGMTLVEFLLARIAEDEAAARAASHDGNSWTDAPAGGWGNGAVETTTHNIVVYDEGRPSCEQGAHIARHDPTRVLAECEAKRRIVEDEHFDGRGGDYIEPWCATCSDDEDLVHLPCPTLRLLALPYSDHPDYRDEWRP